MYSMNRFSFIRSDMFYQPSPCGRIGPAMKQARLIIVILFLIINLPILVHAGDVLPGDSLFVYKLDGTNHCETGTGIDLVAMEHELTDAGITIISMRKGFDGREGIAVCGSPTGQINIYEISAPNLIMAQNIGFKRLPESLINH